MFGDDGIFSIDAFYIRTIEYKATNCQAADIFNVNATLPLRLMFLVSNLGVIFVGGNRQDVG